MKKCNYQDWRTTLVVLFVLCLLSSLGGQNLKVDQLKKQIGQSILDTNRVILFNKLADEYSNINLDSSLVYVNQALDLARRLDYSAGISRALNLQALVYSFESNSVKVKELNEQALRYAQEAGNIRWETTILNDLSVYYFNLGFFDKAIEFGKNASVFQDEYISITYYNLSNYHYEVGDTATAAKYFDRSLKASFTSKDSAMVAFGHQLLGIILFEEYDDQLDSARFHLQKSIDYYEDLSYLTGLSESLFYLGYIEYWLDNPQLCLNYFEKAIAVLDRNRNVVGLGEAYLELVYFFQDQGDFTKAKEYAELGFSICQEAGLPLAALNYLAPMAEIAAAIGDHEQAFQLQKRYQTQKDSFYNKQQLLGIANVMQSFELSKREAENEVLRAEQESVRLTLNNQRLIIIIGALGFLAISIFAGFMWYSNYQKESFNRILEQQVETKTAELQRLVIRLKTSNEELERFNYIASHDLKEPIRNIAMFSDLLKKEQSIVQDPKLNEYLGFVNTNAKQLYYLVQDLMEYARLGYQEQEHWMEVSVKREVDRIEKLLLLDGSFFNVVIDCEDIPPIYTDRTKFFLVLKNLIENGIKYNKSKVRRVSIFYQIKNNMHYIKVRDNGIGIDPNYSEQIFKMFKRLHNRVEYKGSGVGLAICQKIATQLNGFIEVESDESGSIFSFCIPIVDKNDDNVRLGIEVSRSV